MEVFHEDGSLDNSKFKRSALGFIFEALEIATEEKTRNDKCQPGHLLLALWSTLNKNEKWRLAFEMGLSEGSKLDEIREVVEEYVRDWDQDDEPEFHLERADFSEDSISILEHGDDDLINDHGQLISHIDPPVGILELWISAFRHPGASEKKHLKGLVNIDLVASAFTDLHRATHQEIVPGLPDLYSPKGYLRLDLFDDIATTVLETAAERAGGLGYHKILPPHLLIALLERPNRITEQVIRRQATAHIGPTTVRDHLVRGITRSAPKPTILELKTDHLSEALQNIIREAAILWIRNTKPEAHDQGITDIYLLRAVLYIERNGLIGSILGTSGMGFDIDRMIRDIDKSIRKGETEAQTTPFLISLPMAKVQDLTYLARTGQIRASVDQDSLVESMIRGLHKTQNNSILISGESGVGKTELVRELSRRLSRGMIPFFDNMKIILIECDAIPPDQSRDTFTKIVNAVKGRNDVIVCLDHFENILRYSGHQESHNRSLVLAALLNREVQLVVILEDRYLMELLSHDQSLMKMFTHIQVKEMNAEQAQLVLSQSAVPEMERNYGVQIDPEAIRRAVLTSHEFIMSERLPNKAIKMLREACEHVRFDMEKDEDSSNIVREEHVIDAISEYTGVEKETIAGIGTDSQFRDSLSRFIIGQKEAVETVADRLDLIKAGEVSANKPAAVFLIAGLTGTGKTELAKKVAQVYSASKKLSVYPMQNFTEAHSISGILGVPPGYVGHEKGGRLINDLNSDPYGVILFDEAEKCHPEIWLSLLTLFDEGWIIDQRNVKAYGNRAIFILTTNIGQKYIQDHYDDEHTSLEEIKQHIAMKIAEYKHPRHRLIVFPPEFIGRITDILIFNPLSHKAMKDITRLKVNQLIREWKNRRNKDLIVDEEVIDYIAERSYQENERLRQAKGARLVSNYLDSLVRSELTRLIKKDISAYRNAHKIQVWLASGNKISAQTAKNQIWSPLAATRAAKEKLSLFQIPNPVNLVSPLNEQINQTMAQLNEKITPELPSEIRSRVEQTAREAQHMITKQANEFVRTIEAQKDVVIKAIDEASLSIQEDDLKGDLRD